MRNFFRGIGRRASRFLPSRYVVERQYFSANGTFPDLNQPTSFTEKLCFMKLYLNSPLHTRCSNKLLVRDYVKETIGEDFLIPLYFQCDTASDIHPRAFPQEKFVVKANHDSGSAVICRNRDGFDWEATRAFLARRLKNNYYWETRERNYKSIRPQLMVEALLETPGDSSALDFKLHIVGGRFEFCQISFFNVEWNGKERIEHKFFDRNWLPLDIHCGFPISAEDVRRPDCYQEMIELAEALASPFAYSRIDLYLVGEKIYFGEITFYPTGGYARFSPSSLEEELGDKLILPQRFSAL